MTDDKLPTARLYIRRDLDDALQAAESARKLLPHAGLPEADSARRHLDVAVASLKRAREAVGGDA